MNIDIFCGIAGGFVAGFTLATLLLKRHYEKKMIEHDAETRKVFRKLLKKKISEMEMGESDSLEDTTEHKKENPVSTSVTVSTDESFEPVIPSKKYASYRDLLLRLHYGTNPSVIDAYIKDTARHEPYVINQDEYGNKTLDDNYECLSVTYFKKDDCLVDETSDAEIEEVEDFIGKAGWDLVRETQFDSVCVRNEALKLDIEIMIDRDQFGEDVLAGLGE